MSTEKNKAIVLQFYQAFDDRNIEQALDALAPNFIAHMAGLLIKYIANFFDLNVSKLNS